MANLPPPPPKSSGRFDDWVGALYRKVLAAAAGSFTTLSASGLISANGGQIKFPATQAASADANTLDDYEENDWTPTDASGAGLTLTIHSARYTKIGRQVFFHCYLSYPATASGATAMIGGLPFTTGVATCSSWWGDVGNGTAALIAASGTTVQPVGSGSGLTNANLSSANCRASGHYTV